MSAILEFEPELEQESLSLDFSALERMPTDRDLPSDDGEPMETFWHRPGMNILIESIEYHWRDRNDFFVGGNMFMYFSNERVFHKDFRGPDFYLVKGVDHDRERRSWISWQEGGRLPNVIIELLSESTARTDRVLKKQLYGEQFRTTEYYIYDPDTGDLVGWRLTNGGYDQPLDLQSGRLWCQELELFIGPWYGYFQGHERRWLRFFDVDGRVIPTFGEAGQAAAAAEKQRADAEQQKAVAEKQRADAEKLRADNAVGEVERLKAELERLRDANRGG